jgi:ankyrin repeat protein
MAQHRADYMAQHKSICAKRYLKWLQQHSDLDDIAGTATSRSGPRSLQRGIYVWREKDTQQSNNDDPSRSQRGDQPLRIVYEHTFDARLTGDALNWMLRFFETTDDSDAYKQALVAAFRLNITFDSQKTRPLQKSGRFNDLAELAMMIDEVNRDHASINTMDSNGMTILHLACAAGLADLLEPLFWRGASLDTFDEDGLTPLERAVESGDLDTVLFALALGADLAFGSPFTLASHAERRDIMETLTKYGADVNEEDYIGRTALARAIDGKRMDKFRFVLSLGADANLANHNGAHSIFSMLADCEHQDSDGCVHEEIVLILLEHGFIMSSTDHDGDTLLHLAIYKANIRLVGAVLSRITSRDVLDITNDKEWTALHYATYESRKRKHSTHQELTMVSMLLEAGADINARTYDGYTALDFAAGDGNEALVRLLLDAGANINTPRNRNLSMLTLAAYSGKEAVVQMLMDAGADVNMQEEDGNSALIAATRNDHVKIVSMLLDAGADVNLRNTTSGTALFGAVVGGYEDLVRVLLDAGADVNVQTASGMTALSFAVLRDKKEIVRHLLAAGARIDTRTLAWPMRTFVETVLGESGFRAMAK